MAEKSGTPTERTHREHRYNTRQAARLAETPARLQVYAVPTLIPEEYESLAAGSAEAQRKFLEGVGVVSTDIGPLEEVLDSNTTEMISCALQHRKVRDSSIRLTDPYFTDEQRQTVLEGKSRVLISEAANIMEELDTTEELTAIRQKGKRWLEKKGEIPLCACKAHKCEDPDFFTDVLGNLVTLQPPLNDDTGTIFANTLLTCIIKAANLKRITVHGARGGTMGSVHYILRLPSGAEYMYRGRPDFLIYQRFTQEERALGNELSMEESVRGIGEVQSPPGTSTVAKNRAFAQAGIYSLGYFNNTSTRNRIVTVVLYKDMTGHIALATLTRAEGEGELVGDVTYKLVHSVNPFNLRKVDDLGLFASVFIATLKSTMTS